MEKCWVIKEDRPIKLTVASYPCTDGGYCYILRSNPMAMAYDTCNHLDAGHNHQEIHVSARSYDYKNGEAEFIAYSKEDLTKWVDKYSDIVTLLNNP